MNRIILAAPGAEFEELLREVLEKSLNGNPSPDEVLLCEDIGTVPELADEGTQVVILGPGIGIDSALQVAGELDRRRPDISVLLVTEPSPSLLTQALRAGVRGVVPLDSPPEELLAILEPALEAASRRGTSLVDSAPAQKSTRRVITVVSPKGGSGRTMIASNLAVALAGTAPAQVALADLDLQFSDVASALFLNPEQTIADAARSISTLDSTTLKVFLSPHPSGLFVLCGPTSPAEADDITPDQGSRLIELLSSEFRFVVVDTSGGLTEHTLAALELSTDVVLISDMAVASVRSLQKAVEVLDRLGMSSPARHFVLNRADSRVGLDVEDVASTVGMRVDLEIPSSRSVTISLNRGSALVESDARSPVSRSLVQLATRFVDLPVARPSSLLRRRLGR